MSIFIISFSSFLSPLDTDSQLLEEAGVPVFTFLLKQPTAFSLATLFTISLPKAVMLLVKNAFGLGTPDPLGETNDRVFPDYKISKVLAMEMTLVTFSQCRLAASPKWWLARPREGHNRTS